VCDDDGSETEPMRVDTVAQIVGERSFRNVTWREGSLRDLSAQFAAVRARVVTGDAPFVMCGSSVT